MTKFKPGKKFYYSEKNYFNYEIKGTGTKPLVLLHGFGCSIRNWDDVVSELLKKAPGKFKIYVLDLRGMGYSSIPDDEKYTVKENAHVVSEFIKKMDLKHPVICGHSLGGGTALFATVNFLIDTEYYPSGLVLIDSACYPTEYPFFIQTLRIPVLNYFLLYMLNDKYRARKTLDKIVVNKEAITPEMLERYSYFFSLPGHSYALKQTAYNIMPENVEALTSKFGSMTAPTLIIWGDKDTVLKLELAERLHKDIKNSELKILKNCGHNSPEEYPEKVTELIVNFTTAKTNNNKQ